jgi:hypothetical protein
MPFKRVVRANIGDSHALGQKPVTFIRQVRLEKVKATKRLTVLTPEMAK